MKHSRELVLTALLAAIFVVFAAWSPEFRSPANILDQSRYWIEIGILSATMFAVILAGGIDLSVGSILAVCAVTISRLHFELEVPLPLAALGGLAVGTLAGAVNGMLIAFGRIPDLVATLSTLVIFRGLAQLIAENRIYSGFPEWYRWLGDGTVLGVVPAQWLVLVVFWAAVWVLCDRARFGRFVYAIGSNATAALAAGVPVRATRLWLYTLSGFAAGLSATIYTARFNTANSDDARGIELEVVTCVFLGGAAITGGRGTLLGTLLGVLVVGFLRTGLLLVNTTEYTRKISIGALLVLAVAWNELRARERAPRDGRGEEEPAAKK